METDCTGLICPIILLKELGLYCYNYMRHNIFKNLWFVAWLTC